jgi:metal-responsive CopG/Arc/MetJ family transcriptional regulator
MSTKMKFKGVSLPTEILDVLDQLLQIQGMNFSEYTRSLIVQDLDRRNVFTTQLKEELEKKREASPG